MKPGLKLGILGGGQLSRMMALSSYPYGILPHIYTLSLNEPATQVCTNVTVGKLNDEETLFHFIKNCDVVTFESEFWNSELLNSLSQKTQVNIFPAPQLMGLLQDRLTQKKLFEKYKIPTSPFMEASSEIELKNLKSWGKELVLKQRRFGYDGYGTFFISLSQNEKEYKKEWEKINDKSPYGFIIEKKISFKRELALIIARDQHGTMLDFPLVESKQTKARCDWVMGPIKHPKEFKLRTLLKRFLKKENYIGVIAFELFDTGTELLVNEIAPRVHNSGHYSQNALSISQFQAHILAVCGYPLPSQLKLLSPFAMVNLLGQSPNSPEWKMEIEKSNTTNKNSLHLHWYGKIENRQDRKMGHINALSNTPKEALKNALAARRKVLI